MNFIRKLLPRTVNKQIIVSIAFLLCVAAAVGVITIWAENRAFEEQERAFNIQQSLQTLLAQQGIDDTLGEILDNVSSLARYTLVEFETGRQTADTVRDRFLVEDTGDPYYLTHMYLTAPGEVKVERSSAPEMPAARTCALAWAAENWDAMQLNAPQSQAYIPPIDANADHQWLGILYPVTVNNQFRGVLVAVYDLGPLIRRYVVPITNSKDSISYILDGQGRLIYHPQTRLIGQNIIGQAYSGYPEALSVAQRMLAEKSGVDTYHIVAGPDGTLRRMLVAWDTLHAANQSLVITLAAPAVDVEAHLRTLRAMRNLLSTVLALVVLCSTAYFFTQRQVLLNEHSKDLEQQVFKRSVELLSSQEDLRRSRDTLHALIDVSPLPIVMLDTEDNVQIWNQAAEHLFGWSAEEVIGQKLLTVPEGHQSEFQQMTREMEAGASITNRETVRARKDGSLVALQISAALLTDLYGQAAGRMAILSDLSERKKMENEARIEEARLKALVRISQQRNGSLDHILDQALEEAICLSSSQIGYIFHYDEERRELTLHDWSPETHRQCSIPNPPSIYPLDGTGLWGEAIRQRRPLMVNDFAADNPLKHGYPEGHVPIRRFLTLPIFSDEHIVALVGVGNKDSDYTDLDVRELSLLMDAVWRIVEREEAEARLRLNNQRLAAFDHISQTLAGIHLNFTETLNSVTQFAAEWFGDICHIGILDEAQKEFIINAVYAADPQVESFIKNSMPDLNKSNPEIWIMRQVIESGQPIFMLKVDLDLLQLDNPELREVLARRGIRSLMVVPLRDQRRVFGVMTMVRLGSQPRSYNAEDQTFLLEVANRAALAISNADLYEDNQRKLHHMQALYSIETAITSSLDMTSTLKIIVNQILIQLKVDAADILLYNTTSQRLEAVSSSGFNGPLPSNSLRLGDTPAGWTARERQILFIADLQVRAGWYEAPAYFRSEGFVTYFGLPLVARGQLRGVLEIFHRQPFQPNQQWSNMLQTLVGQAAIALDHATLYLDLQRSNFDLTLAYDETIEGWSRALDLRDNETEGHSWRVTELTDRLASRLGVPDTELIHLRRGALLHDIGKMGIPDQILRKPGPLEDEELKIMRQHPQFAFDMLYPIQYLRPALDIPIAHHEKWDGSGYPRGLKDGNIPLAARIFAVIDVYDALSNDRPYRLAWPHEKVIAYLRSESGKHFDPQVLKVFLEMIEEE